MATIVFGQPQWAWPALIGLALATVALIWGYARSPGPRSTRIACAGLKFTAFALLLACLLEPLWTGQRVRPGANFFAIVADNSLGMTLQESPRSPSRGEQLRTLLREDSNDSWIQSLGRDFRVRRYQVDSTLYAKPDFSELDFSGTSSQLLKGLASLGTRYRARPLAGVILLTDGIATDIAAELPGEAASLPPVYAVMIGSQMPEHELAFANTSISTTSFEDAPVAVTGEVLARGFAGSQVVVELWPLDPKQDAAPPEDSPAQPIAQQSLQVSEAHEIIPYHLTVHPPRGGLHFYRLKVTSDNGTITEATLANNEEWLVADRGQGPFRVLYVAGRPNWEYKFLNRALAEDDQIQMPSLIRIALREGFDFKGRIGESSNPLYRGFDKKDEETERYDQPVLTRLNLRDSSELLGGFPNRKEQLFEYHAIILDDVEAEFFTHDQLNLIRQFVSDRGGGFLMLGGEDTFANGGYQHTSLAGLLPVYLDQANATVPSSVELELTREGWLQPWVRLRDNAEREQDRLREMPGFQVVSGSRGIKPGASVLSQIKDPSGNSHPALIVQNFGRGRSAALMIGDLWRWGLRSPAHRVDLEKAWRQTVRWLIADVPEPVDIAARAGADDPDQTVELEVHARDESYAPLEDGRVTVQVTHVNNESTGGRPVTLAAEPDPTEPGLYRTTFVGRSKGAYQAEAIVHDTAGNEMARAVTGYTLNPGAAEFRSLEPNAALLQKIAQATGGEMLIPNELPALVKSLPRREAPVTEPWSKPIWHQPWIFLIAIGLLAAEWGLRRWKGLA